MKFGQHFAFEVSIFSTCNVEQGNTFNIGLSLHNDFADGEFTFWEHIQSCIQCIKQFSVFHVLGNTNARDGVDFMPGQAGFSLADRRIKRYHHFFVIVGANHTVACTLPQIIPRTATQSSTPQPCLVQPKITVSSIEFFGIYGKSFSRVRIIHELLARGAIIQFFQWKSSLFFQGRNPHGGGKKGKRIPDRSRRGFLRFRLQLPVWKSAAY